MWIQVYAIGLCCRDDRSVDPQGYEPGHLGVREKKIMAEKRHIRQQVQFTVTTYKLEIHILLIWQVQFMEMAARGVRK